MSEHGHGAPVQDPVSTTEAIGRAVLLGDPQLLETSTLQLRDPAARLKARICALGVHDETVAARTAARLVEESDDFLGHVGWLCREMARIRQGLPILEPGALPRRLARLVDPDALFVLHPDVELPASERFAWAAVPLPESGRIRGLFRQGSVDTHIHLGGTLPPVFYWLPLMSGQLAYLCLRDLPSPERGHAEADLWIERVARAGWLRLYLAARLEESLASHGYRPLFFWLPELWFERVELQAGAPGPRTPSEAQDLALALTSQRRFRSNEEGTVDGPFMDPLRPPASTTERPHYAAGERRLLFHLGRWLRHGGRYRAIAETGDARYRTFEYLQVRNAFHRLLVHERGSEGLMRFGETFRRRRVLKGRRRRTPSRQERYRRTLLRLERSRMTAALAAQLVQPYDGGSSRSSVVAGELAPSLRRLEIRVSIPPLRDFVPTLRAWLDGIADHLRSEVPESTYRPTQVGLVFHFLKKPGPDDQRRDEARGAAERLAFVLREYPWIRPFVVGIDAAGPERVSNPRVFGDAYRHLQNEEARHRAEPDDPAIRLGWTFHVGEDVDDLLTGLRHVDEATCLLLPRHAGGRLGHALALGDDPRRFYDRRGGQTEPSRGTHLLDLVWAWGRLLETDGAADASRWLEYRIRQLAGNPDADVEGCFAAMGLTREVVNREVLLEDRLLDGLQKKRDGRAASLSADERRTPLTITVDDRWLAIVELLQTLLRERVARRRVCVEANPSSNLLIGQYVDYRQLPYQALIDAGIAVSLNTDDPGLFMTSLPGEFSAMYEALAERMPHREVLACLAERVFDAEQSTFLDRGVPAGEDAVRQIERLRGDF